MFDGIDPADHGLFLAYYYEVGSACWLQLQERGLLSRAWLFGVSRDGVKVLNDSPRVHPQVQNPGALAVPLSTQQLRCVQLHPRIFEAASFAAILRRAFLG